MSDTEDDKSRSQVLVRVPPESHERWKEAAAKLGISMSEFVRRAADRDAKELLDCSHELAHRRWYPWAEVCLHCGTSLREGKKWLVDPDSIPQMPQRMDRNR